jgi:hypothetical protein
MIKSVNNRKFIRIKLKKFSKEVILKKLTFVIQMKCLDGLAMIKAIMSRIEIVK